MKKIALLITVVVGLAGCSKPSKEIPLSSSSQTTYDQCVEKGIQYFKEIKSYPKLSDGRNAKAVAKDRCSRSLQAFGLDS